MVTIPKWVKTALPIAGLAIVPLVGLVYVSTASFGKPSKTAASATPSATASSFTAPIREADLPDDPVISRPNPAPKIPRPTSLFPGGAPQTTGVKDSAMRLCCEKLSELARGAEVSARASYNAAAAACNAAPSTAQARKQIATVLDGRELPAECDGR